MSLRTRTSVVALVVAVSWTACGRAPDTTRSALPLGPGPEVRFAAQGAVAARPAIAARGRTVAVAWLASFGSTTALFVATSGDGGRTFRPPIRIANASAVVADEAPRLFFDSSETSTALVVEWVERTGAINVARYAQSNNGGLTFVPDRPDAVRLVYTGASAEDPDIPAAVIAATAAPGASNWRGVVDAEGTLVLVWDESNGPNRRVSTQRVVIASDGSFTRLPSTPVTAWGRSTRPAIAATPGGVIVAWIDEQAGRPTVALRPVGFETLCADPNAAATNKLTFDWEPWPFRPPPPKPKPLHD